jgi:hypothetical protein
MPNMQRILVHLWLLAFLATASFSQTASFIGFDATTQGNWKGKYGAQGYSIAGNGVLTPSYVVPGVSGATFVWNRSTSDIRALQSASTSGRIAATWYSQPSMLVELNFTDQNFHQVAIYCLDWDSNGPRRQTIEILDANNNVLDTRSLNSFVGGQYLVWNLKGRLKVRATTLSINAVIGGIFFDGGIGGITSTSEASFVSLDTVTKGNWKGKYGTDGYKLAADGTSHPPYVVPGITGSLHSWNSSTYDDRGLQKAAGTDRIAAAWYAQPSFSIDLNFTDQNSHQVAIYCVDWDSYGPRRQSIEILDANNTVLDTRTLSSFTGGQYLVWNLKGAVKIRATALTTNAVIAGIFFGGGGASTPEVSFVTLDTVTQGNWKGKYGADGYKLAGDGTSNPAYVVPGMAGTLHSWNSSTYDNRGLQKAVGADRIAATWYSQTNFSIDLNFTDQNFHQVAIHCLDWDSYGPRRQTIEILDANNKVLDTRPLSSFVGGQYLVWNLKGHVKIRATALNTNAVIGGIFFGGGGASVPPIPQLQTWQKNMTDGGTRFCKQDEINSAIGAGGVASEGNVWYYDGARVYTQIAAYTNSPSWLTCAGYSNLAYRSWVLAVTEGITWPVGALNGWRIFPHGLLSDYKKSGSSLSRTAVQRLAKYSAFAGSGGAASCHASRETAYIINAYLASEALGDPRNPLLATAVNYALGHIDQWYVAKSCSNMPVMVGLTLEALIDYYEVTADPRIPPAIALAAEELWNRAWMASANSFYYESTNPTLATPDLNLLIAPAYAWLWQRTGEKKYQERGDQIFAGGVLQATFWSGKQFSQNYRSSFNYVRWRSALPGSVPLSKVP